MHGESGMTPWLTNSKQYYSSSLGDCLRNIQDTLSALYSGRDRSSRPSRPFLLSYNSVYSRHRPCKCWHLSKPIPLIVQRHLSPISPTSLEVIKFPLAQGLDGPTLQCHMSVAGTLYPPDCRFPPFYPPCQGSKVNQLGRDSRTTSWETGSSQETQPPFNPTPYIISLPSPALLITRH
jgi:hypothetical protein